MGASAANSLSLSLSWWSVANICRVPDQLIKGYCPERRPQQQNAQAEHQSDRTRHSDNRRPRTDFPFAPRHF